ncbi:unnamed protein product [Oppiella nova]|uniref:Protein kinase domain-containing protein n=1 Tax=Oppiella nova TaxID=334625 RepID=A0A7R9MI36_9ACAR|nr:unnamed protein product [Oppiella nova]CAG2177509.1 unnamed protein product [Oppiella nova]
MELCSESLRNILKHKPKEFGRQSGESMNCYESFTETSNSTIRRINELLRIIHRDLKPHNILIDRNGRNGRFVKLCDFGLATLHDKSKHTSDVGTIGFIAPEVVEGLKYNNKCDFTTVFVK